MLSPILLAFMIFLFMLILNGSVYSAVWAMHISSIIARERERRTYDVYCLSPDGELGVNWAICTGYLHRHNRLEQIRGFVGSLLVVSLGVVALITLFIVTNAGSSSRFAQDETQRAYMTLIHTTTLVAALYIDHYHSIVMGSLVGMIAPTLTQARLDAQLGAMGIYLVLQISVYTLGWFIALTLLPTLFGRGGNWWSATMLAVLQVVVFFIIREIVTIGLWRALLRQLNISPVELDFMPPRLTL
jgi:hypothetical protein